MTEFNLGKLWPNFEHLRNGALSDPEGITALFVLITMVITGIFILTSCYCLYVARKKYSFYRTLMSKQDKESLATKRRDIKNKAFDKEKKEHWPELWGEFDETFVEVDGQLQNTLEASTYFNTTTLAGSLVGNRLLAAGPGIITGLGVLGTFIGLQLGLGHLSLDGNSQQMQIEIQGLVASASIAFTTSVWGVLLSLCFNFFEKILERHAKNRIGKLQAQIDELFPRFSASQLFVDIRDDGRESRKIMQGLAERIGDRMQEAVSNVSESIQVGLEDSLKNVFAPAVDRLVTAAEEMGAKQAHGSEEALRQLIEQFTENVSKEGDNQREAMSAASTDVRNALSELGTNMSTFFDVLEKQQASLRDEQDQRGQLLEANFAASMKQQEEIIEYVRNSVGGQLGATESLLKQGEVLGSNVVRSNEMMDEIANKMESVTGKLQSTSGHLENASGGLSTAISGASRQIRESADIASRLMQENTRVNENVNRVMSLIDDVKNGVKESTDTLNQAIGAARDGYSEVSKHYLQLQNKLESHVEDLESQIAKLLTDYGNIVNAQTAERLGEWDKQTQNYTKAMSDAIDTISSVVEEIEVKVGGGK
jgi:hypothetical protein